MISNYMSRRVILPFLYAIVVSFFIGCSGSTEQLVIEKTLLEKDTVWSGEILINGDVEVAEGVTLTIMPGTVVKFAKVEPFGTTKMSKDKLNHFPGSEIIVRGRILAQGTAEQRIVFTSADSNPEPGDWGAVNMLISVGNIIEYCEFSYAHTAVHSHSAHVVVVNNYFHHNGVAVGQKNVKTTDLKCAVPMFYNTFTENGGAILFGGGSSPTISHNEINNNSFFGIYVKKGGVATIRYNNITKNGKGVIFYSTKGVILRENNINDNTDYNISMLDGQVADLQLKNNWWGTTDEKAIKKLIRDNSNDKSLGQVDFSGYSDSPLLEAKKL